MSIKYNYAGNQYDSENEAQDAATALSVRMQNNPTDWIGVKEITGSNETGWLINSKLLTDAEILTPDENKTYTCFSPYSGENVIPVTATELKEKNNEYRKIYGQYWDANIIQKIECDDNGYPTSSVLITPTTDMSGYV
tara:strand:- start:384 stop:797 length:414 start_codon:yes stop_codon:yes gene_type:complete